MIIDLIKDYVTSSTVVTGFQVGEFVFDCELEESHESRLTVTENKLESGAAVSDHSYLEPKTYGVRGLMVSYKPFNAIPASITDTITAAKVLPQLTGIIGKTEQAIAKVNRYAGNVLQTIDKAKAITSKLSPWLPDSLASLGDNTNQSLTRQAQAYSDLLTIQNSGQFLTVSSGLKSYSNMLLTSVLANNGADDSVEFVLQFREAPVTSTRTVQGLVVNVPTVAAQSKVDGENKTGRAENQAEKVKSKGKTQPVQQPTTKKSVARSIGDVIRGL